jgi:hypothetical protein
VKSSLKWASTRASALKAIEPNSARRTRGSGERLTLSTLADMVTPPGEKRSSASAGAGQPHGRLSKRQELALFIVMMVVLLGLVAYGLRA